MGTLLTFSPFLVFTATNWAVGPDAGLVAGLLASFVLLLHDWNRDARREPGVFDLSVFALFALLALYDGLGEPLWTAAGVQVRVEAGMLLALCASMVVRRPATLPAASALLGLQGKGDAAFVGVNDVLCLAWATALGVMMAGELLGQALPDTDPFTSSLVTVAAVSCAEAFCRWYLGRHTGHGPRRAG